ncbi:hypothetical protein GCM10009087_09030 [Sphingomonas oligophenolica]|uniref:Uncharacterized protein n=1 Tax=Sphingomonas oligophenolica TaxID=301154 RepID=A0ABU9XXV8_9SPHN
MLKLVVALACLTLSVPSFAQEAAPSAPAGASDAAKPVKVKKPRRICRSDQSTTTRMTSQTCHTADEWAAIDRSNGQAPTVKQGGVTTY